MSYILKHLKLDLSHLVKVLKTLKALIQDFFTSNVLHSQTFKVRFFTPCESYLDTQSTHTRIFHLKCLILFNYPDNIFYISRDYERYSNHSN